MYNKIPFDRYADAKKRHDEMSEKYGMGMPFDAVPVDLYGGFVPMEKNASDNLEKTVKCNSERFGIEEVVENV